MVLAAEFGGPDPGMPPGFAAMFVLALLVGIGTTVWKVSTARRMARDSGMNEGDATAMTLLSDEGFEATYLASNLRPSPQQPTSPPATPAATTESRLAELQSLKDRGLVTEQEYAEARRRILDQL